MPIRKTSKGWYWGSKGPFDTKEKAEEVMRAAFASGYKSNESISFEDMLERMKAACVLCPIIEAEDKKDISQIFQPASKDELDVRNADKSRQEQIRFRRHQAYLDRLRRKREAWAAKTPEEREAEYEKARRKSRSRIPAETRKAIADEVKELGIRYFRVYSERSRMNFHLVQSVISRRDLEDLASAFPDFEFIVQDRNLIAKQKNVVVPESIGGMFKPTTPEEMDMRLQDPKTQLHRAWSRPPEPEESGLDWDTIPEILDGMLPPLKDMMANGEDPIPLLLKASKQVGKDSVRDWIGRAMAGDGDGWSVGSLVRLSDLLGGKIPVGGFGGQVL